ncbi:MAG TPA: IS66 family transposase [Burkholderiaceae bacterium]|nr:IS66 family transposase [Burkholderiaceae bacterium]
MQVHDELDRMDAQQLREFATRLLETLTSKDHELRYQELKIEQLTHEMAVLKRWKFAARSEQLHGAQRTLFDEAIDADLEAIAAELATLRSAEQRQAPTDPPKRSPLPAQLPRVDVRHEPEQTVCACGCALKRIGEDVSEKLDYTPGVFHVERHIRGKWVCAKCQTLIQAPVPAEVIDKGIPTAGLLAQVLVAKYADHQPLYRQEGIFERAGVAIPRSTLAQWVGVCGVRLQPLVDALRARLLECSVLHADETPVAMLTPGKGKTHRAYVWSYSSTQFDALHGVVYDFADSRAAVHAKAFLDGWSGKLVCDDYAGYKALFATGVTEVGCLAHARRKFNDLWVNHQSALAEQALQLFGALYNVERQARELSAEQRQRTRQLQSRPIADKLREWLLLHRQTATDGTALAKAIDYSLARWDALTRFLDDGDLPIDNNWVENRIRPIALGRSNWLFAGSLRAGKRAAAVMSLIQSAKLNGHDPYRYLKDVLERLPTQAANRIQELLPHCWTPATTI